MRQYLYFTRAASAPGGTGTRGCTKIKYISTKGHYNSTKEASKSTNLPPNPSWFAGICTFETFLIIQKKCLFHVLYFWFLFLSSISAGMFTYMHTDVQADMRKVICKQTNIQTWHLCSCINKYIYMYIYTYTYIYIYAYIYI